MRRRTNGGGWAVLLAACLSLTVLSTCVSAAKVRQNASSRREAAAAADLDVSATYECLVARPAGASIETAEAKAARVEAAANVLRAVPGVKVSLLLCADIALMSSYLRNSSLSLPIKLTLTYYNSYIHPKTYIQPQKTPKKNPTTQVNGAFNGLLSLRMTPREAESSRSALAAQCASFFKSTPFVKGLIKRNNSPNNNETRHGDAPDFDTRQAMKAMLLDKVLEGNPALTGAGVTIGEHSREEQSKPPGTISSSTKLLNDCHIYFCLQTACLSTQTTTNCRHYVRQLQRAPVRQVSLRCRCRDNGPE